VIVAKQGEPMNLGILQGCVAKSQAGFAQRPIWIDHVYPVTDETNLRQLRSKWSEIDLLVHVDKDRAGPRKPSDKALQ
jgi:hypothetical protein